MTVPGSSGRDGVAVKVHDGRSFRDADQVYRRVRADLGLPKPRRFVLDEMASPFLHLQGSTAGFEYPIRSMPEHMHYVGALRPDPPRDWTPPDWWDEDARWRSCLAQMTSREFLRNAMGT